MAMVEVTNRCNMACPICYSDAGKSSEDVPIDKIRLYLERLLKLTETPIPIQIIGVFSFCAYKNLYRFGNVTPSN